MRINDSKSRRILIMQQISFRQHSREQSRKSSAERRKKIQESLNDFTKTMSDVSYRKTGGSEAFNYKNDISEKILDDSSQVPQKHQLKKEYDQVLRSPSFKDITVLDENESKLSEKQKQMKQNHVRFEVQVQNSQQQQNNITDEQITYRQVERNNEKLTPKSIMQNESSASAIFFTSQFNEFINKNHPQSNENLPQQQKQTQKHQKQISQNQSNNLSQLPQKNQFPNQQNQSNIKQHDQTKHLQVSEQQQILKLSQRKDVLDPIAEINAELSPRPETIEEQDKQKQPRMLIKNKSGYSLAFSNESSLKYSLYESNIKEILTRKFAHQLIADTNQFDVQNENSSLFLHLKLQIMAEKLYQHEQKSIHRQFCSFAKLYQLLLKVQKRQKRMYFEAFIINQELNLQEKKNKIKCDQYLQEKQQSRIKTIFNHLKQNFFTHPQEQNQKALYFLENKENEMKQRIFRCLKIAWFDQKVKKQIDLYYLSKLFSHFTRVIKTQKQLTRKKCLSFYCFNLKKRYFQHLKQGVDSMQSERIQRDNAQWHYAFTLQRKVFDAWRQKLSYKDRYISLAMTTKNTFKQTADQRWLQIKTVDFRQLK